MYKRSSKFLTRSWPGPRTKSRAVEKVNAELTRQRILRAPPTEHQPSLQEIEEDRQMLAELIQRLAGILSGSEFLQSLPQSEIDYLVSMTQRIDGTSTLLFPSKSFDYASAGQKLERVEAVAYLLPFVEKFLSESVREEDRE